MRVRPRTVWETLGPDYAVKKTGKIGTLILGTLVLISRGTIHNNRLPHVRKRKKEQRVDPWDR